ncbi:MAG: 50S ribosomal protein L29 [Phycisphaeraceae bacterium]|nr:50S ribosomal protein L29 [Phycisphaeraceae bacterium]
MNAAEVHKMTDEELKVERERLTKQLYELRCQAVTEKLENPKQLQKIRRDVARILTERRRRTLQAQGA